MFHFLAKLEIIGVNPFVSVPQKILAELFKLAGRDKGPIPVRGEVNHRPFQQTLVRYRGAWRLYINTKMLKDSPRKIGELLELSIAVDTSDRSIAVHPDFLLALKKNTSAKRRYDHLSPSLQKEITRYITSLKTKESVERNIQRAINFLTGKDRFIGREPLKK